MKQGLLKHLSTRSVRFRCFDDFGHLSQTLFHKKLKLENTLLVLDS
ncbi:hypothetical protein Z947_370 [Sulfitobacter geojensis]|nr:hypothetical protein Z947_370 [Sulfitobacter geojensis]